MISVIYWKLSIAYLRFKICCVCSFVSPLLRVEVSTSATMNLKWGCSLHSKMPSRTEDGFTVLIFDYLLLILKIHLCKLSPFPHQGLWASHLTGAVQKQQLQGKPSGYARGRGEAGTVLDQLSSETFSKTENVWETAEYESLRGDKESGDEIERTGTGRREEWTTRSPQSFLGATWKRNKETRPNYCSW